MDIDALFEHVARLTERVTALEAARGSDREAEPRLWEMEAVLRDPKRVLLQMREADTKNRSRKAKAQARANRKPAVVASKPRPLNGRKSA